MQTLKFKKGDIVRVTRKTNQSGKKPKGEPDFRNSPTVGVVVFAHPLHLFYTVEFRDSYSAQYKPMYRESFFPEMMEKANDPHYFDTRPAQQRNWVRKE